MTQEERVRIFSKEVLSVKDIKLIFDCSQDTAYKTIREIKSTSDRLGLSGCCHVQDYIEHYKLPIDRYLIFYVKPEDVNKSAITVDLSTSIAN